MFDLNNKYQFKAFVANIAGTNFYNEIHKIIRIEFNNKYYDFKYLGGYEVPDPQSNLAIVITSDEALNDIGISEERQRLLPGFGDPNGNLVDLPTGFVYLISNKQTVATTNPNSGGAGFSISKTNMFDLQKVAIAISPPIQKDYTSTDTAFTTSEVDSGVKEDVRNQNVGIFINKDGTILVKSKGSSITMGEEGIYIAGSVSWESSEHQREWMMDNPFQRFIPSTIPTAAIAIPELPNIAKFVQIAEGARKVRTIINKVSSVSKLVSRM